MKADMRGMDWPAFSQCEVAGGARSPRLSNGPIQLGVAPFRYALGKDILARDLTSYQSDRFGKRACIQAAECGCRRCSFSLPRDSRPTQVR